MKASDWRRRALALMTFGAFTFGLLATFGPNASAQTPPSSEPSTPKQRAVRVQLRSIDVRGATRTYVATVLDDQGRFVPMADLDLGALGSDPDLRVTTTPMLASNDDNSYRATVAFPANGDWVIVVRVHEPTQLVELFTEAITTAPATEDGHASMGFSRAAVLRSDPTFFDRYDPTKSMTASGSTMHTDSPLASAHDDPIARSAAFSPVAFGGALLHTGGALAWLIASLGLVVAHRVGPGVARHQLVALVSNRYRLLAGGGLLTVVVTGLINIDKNSPGISHPRGLMNSNVGMAYLAVFGFKMAVVVASFVTTHRIDQLLGTDSVRFSSTGVRLTGTVVGAQAQLFRLAERNALLGGVILASVALLSNLHRLLH